MPAPLTIGALGCSDIAQRRTLPALDATPGVELACVGSRRPARAREFADLFGGAALSSYEAVLERDDVDAVYISVPSMLHAAWATRALEAGKHVLVEKPLATTGADAARLFRLAEERGLVLMENFMFLHHGQHRRVSEILASGELGEIRAFSAAFTIPPRPEGDSRYDPELGGGALLDNGVYPLRAALRFLGTDLALAGASLRRCARRRVDLSGAALLATPGGATAQVRFGMEHHYRSWYEIQGSLGTLAVDHVFTTAPTHEPVLRLTVGLEAREVRLPAENHFVSLLRAFATAVREPAFSKGELARLGAESLCQARLLDDVRDRAAVVTV